MSASLPCVVGKYSAWHVEIVQERQSGTAGEQVEAGNTPPGAGRKKGAQPPSTACWVLTHHSPQSLQTSTRPPFPLRNAVTFRSATQRLAWLKQEGAPSPVEANRGWEDGGRAGEKEHSGKQQHLLSCICLSLASYGEWQSEMHVVCSAFPVMDVESSQMAVTFSSPLQVSVSLSLTLSLCLGIAFATSHWRTDTLVWLWGMGTNYWVKHTVISLQICFLIFSVKIMMSTAV